MIEEIYLDNQTITQPSPSALDAMAPFFKEFWGTPGAPHQKGNVLFGPIDKAMSMIYEGVGANYHDRFTFTASGAEAIRQVFYSTYVELTRETGRNHYLSTAIEDPSILQAVHSLQKLDCVGKFLPVDAAGRLRPEVLEEAIRPRTALVSLSWANSLTGVIQPIEDLARLCREKEVPLHVDASHVIGKLFFRFGDAGMDYLTFDGDRFHAPKGTGGLFCRKGRAIQPSADGSNMNVPAVIALGLAFEEALQNFDALCTETARLRDKLESGIAQAFPGAQVFFQDAERLPNTSVIAFPGVASEALLYALHRRGLYAARGRMPAQTLAMVLQACGVEACLAVSSLSFALSYFTKEEEIDRAIAIITESAQQLRKVTGRLL